MKLTKVEEAFFDKTVNNLLQNPLVRSMEKYSQHGSTNTLMHSISVSYRSYKMGIWLKKKFGMKIRLKQLIRASMLHDFFLYDWHESKEEHRLHGFTHPYTAFENASKEYNLSKLEENIIKRHMFPFTPLPPKFKEGWLVTTADKYVALKEVFEQIRRKFNRPQKTKSSIQDCK